MCKRQRVILASLIFVHISLSAQKEAYNWYFGNKAAITFNSGIPQSMGGSQMNAWEGVASISDANGQLLFYTDGINVWNRNHQIMPNGSGLSGDPSSAQTGVIVPKPGNPNLYYVFSVPKEGGSLFNPAKLRYSVIDMTLDGGKGDVIPGQKNIQLGNHTVQEKITAVKHCNNRDIWIITHEHNSNKFIVYLLDNVNNAPQLISEQNIGESWGSSGWNAIGCLKASPDGRKIAETSNNNNKAQILDFDNMTGTLSNPVVLTGLEWCYGVEFSPDNTKLYISIWYDNSPGGKRIYQYDLTAPNIAASRVQINTGSIIGQLQLGPDGKIYVARNTNDTGGPNNGRRYLGCITNPNAYDGTPNACGYVDLAVDLGGDESNPAGGRLSRFGLPNFIQSYFNPPSDFTYTDTCYGQSTNFHAIINSTYDSVRWNFGNLGYALTPNANFYFPAPGNYLVTLYVFKRCVTDTIAKNITILNAPVLNYQGPTSVCSNALTTHSVSYIPGCSYSWTLTGNGTIVSGANTNQVSIQWGNSGSGQLTVTVNNSGSCSRDTTINITISSNLSITVNPTNPSICQGNQIQLTANGAANYTWFPSNTLSSSVGNTVVATPTQTTTYTISGSDINGCTGQTTVTVTVFPLPTVTISPNNQSICKGDTLVICANGANSYNWQPNNYILENNNNCVKVLPDFSVIYTVIGTDNNGCQGSNTVSVVVRNLPIIEIIANPTTVCLGNSTTLTATGASTYYWTSSTGGNLASNQGNVVTATPSENCTYYVIGTDQNGCKNTSQISVNVVNAPQIQITANKTEICPGENVILTASGANNYNWSTGQISQQITVIPISTTTYSVTGSTSNNCYNDTSITIKVYPLPDVDFYANPKDGCGSLNVNFTSNADSSISSFYWNFGDNSNNTTDNPSITHTYDKAGIYTVSLTITTNKGCTSSISKPNYIRIYATPVADFTYSPTVTYKGGNVTFISTSQNSDLCSWNFGDQNSENNTSYNCSTNHIFNNAGTYNVELIVSTANGLCSDTISKQIEVIDLTIPNVITSNNDGKNDYFKIPGLENIENANIKIFNRWGKIVYESKNYKNDWAPSNISDGVYYYILKLDENNTFHGNITVLK